MFDEGNKTILVTMPVSLWLKIKEVSHLNQMTLSAWVRELIIKELNK